MVEPMKLSCNGWRAVYSITWDALEPRVRFRPTFWGFSLYKRGRAVLMYSRTFNFSLTVRKVSLGAWTNVRFLDPYHHWRSPCRLWAALFGCQSSTLTKAWCPWVASILTPGCRECPATSISWRAHIWSRCVEREHPGIYIWLGGAKNSFLRPLHMATSDSLYTSSQNDK